MTISLCWHGKGDDAEFGSKEWADSMAFPGTCLLPDGHEGPHEYTPDEQIVITFADNEGRVALTELEAEVNRLDLTGDIWQRTQSDIEAWKQAYVRTKVQRDELLAACEAAYELVANMGDVEELHYHGQGESALREMLRAAIAKARGE